MTKFQTTKATRQRIGELMMLQAVDRFDITVAHLDIYFKVLDRYGDAVCDGLCDVLDSHLYSIRAKFDFDTSDTDLCAKEIRRLLGSGDEAPF